MGRPSACHGYHSQFLLVRFGIWSVSWFRLQIFIPAVFVHGVFSSKHRRGLMLERVPLRSYVSSTRYASLGVILRKPDRGILPNLTTNCTTWDSPPPITKGIQYLLMMILMSVGECGSFLFWWFSVANIRRDNIYSIIFLDPYFAFIGV